MLQMQFVRKRAAAAPAGIVVVDDIYVSNSTDLTTYTFSNVALTGTWTHLLIAVTARGTGSAPTVSSLTVEGNAATYGGVRNQTGFQGTEIWAIANSTATPDIVVTMGAACVNCSITVIAVTGMNSVTPTDNASDDTDTFDFVIDCNAGGIIFGVILNVSTTATCTWTSAGTPVEITDGIYVDPGAGGWVTHAAYELIAANQTGYTLTGDLTATNSAAGLALSYR